MDYSFRLRSGVCNARSKVHSARFKPHMLFICVGRDSNFVVCESILGQFLVDFEGGVGVHLLVCTLRQSGSTTPFV